jgi:hypothetical protein
MQGLYQNKLAAAEIGSKALNGEITPSEADKKIRELPDNMADYRDYLKTHREATKEQDRLAPSGVDPKLWKHMTPEERALWK